MKTPEPKKTRGPSRQPLEVASHSAALLLPSTVYALTGLQGDSVRRLVKAGTFPPPVALTATTHRWPASAVNAWLEQQAAKGASIASLAASAKRALTTSPTGTTASESRAPKTPPVAATAQAAKGGAQ